MTNEIIAEKFNLDLIEDSIKIRLIHEKFYNIKTYLNQLVFAFVSNKYTLNNDRIKKCLNRGSIKRISVLENKNLQMEYSYHKHKGIYEKYIIEYKDFKDRINLLKRSKYTKDLKKIKTFEAILKICEKQQHKVIFKDYKFFEKN